MVKASNFGTDGLRGTVGQEPVTVPAFEKIGLALGSLLAKSCNESSATVMLAHDGRSSFDSLGRALARGLQYHNIVIENLGLLPTPVLAQITKEKNANCGIMVTASHNPAQDNGLKFFQASGEKWTKNHIQALVAEISEKNEIEKSGLDKLWVDIPHNETREHYGSLVKSIIANLKNKKHYRIVMDCANGATSRLGPWMLKHLGHSVVAIHNTPDGKNINDNCGSLHTEAIQKRVIVEKADGGIAFDGDGDRVVLIDEEGAVLDGDNILYILANSTELGKHEGVVSTIMTNSALTDCLNDMGIRHEKVAVGDKHVFAKLKEKGWQLGGEPSGHIIWLPYSQSGDGILAGLLAVLIGLENNTPLSWWRKKLPKYPRELLNFSLLENQAKQKKFEQWVDQQAKAHQNRVDIGGRRSGTEPIYRVSIESKSLKDLQELSQACKKKHQSLLA